MHQRSQGRRSSHEEALLAHLREHGASDRAELAEALGLSRATVSTLSRDLLAGGALVLAAPAPRRQRTGRRPELLTLNPDAGVLVGVDLGHTHVTVAAADAAHVVVGTRTASVGTAPWDQRIERAVAMSRALVQTRGRPALLGVGVGIAGSIAHRDAVVAQTRRALRSAFDVPVLVDNNTRLAGLAEHVWGVARGMTDVVYLRLAAGVGGAVVLDGQVRLGPRALAGELGHVNVTDEPLACRCGNRGCLETVAGRDALLDASGTADLDTLSLALGAGDRLAETAVQRAADAIGRVLAGACTTLDVRDVVVAGELLRLGEHLLTPVRSSLARHALATGPEAPRLHRAQLGQSAGALGGIGALLRDPQVPMPLTTATAAS